MKKRVINYTNKFRFICRGSYRYNGAGLLDKYKSSHTSYLFFKEEPKNKFDPNAIMIICRGEFHGLVGYVGKEFTKDIKDIITNNPRYFIRVLDTKNIVDRGLEMILYY